MFDPNWPLDCWSWMFLHQLWSSVACNQGKHYRTSSTANKTLLFTENLTKYRIVWLLLPLHHSASNSLNSRRQSSPDCSCSHGAPLNMMLLILLTNNIVVPILRPSLWWLVCSMHNIFGSTHFFIGFWRHMTTSLNQLLEFYEQILWAFPHLVPTIVPLISYHV